MLGLVIGVAENIASSKLTRNCCNTRETVEIVRPAFVCSEMHTAQFLRSYRRNQNHLTLAGSKTLTDYNQIIV